MRRARTFTSLLMLLAAATACGSDAGSGDSATADTPAGASAAAAAGGAVAPCTILTNEEMAAAIGAPVTQTDRTAPTRCIYRTANPLVYVDLEVDRENADASWQGVQAGNAIIDAPQDTLVALGAQAFFGPRDRLYVRRGTTFLAVEAGFDDGVRDRARRVAAAVLEKLP